MRMKSGSRAGQHGRFETTHWSLVFRAGADDDRQAASRLCRTYWGPVYVFFRSKGAGADEAEDLTQEFFADLDRRRDFRAVDPTRGRFRTWLRACAANHLFRFRKRQKALKRNGGEIPLSLDGADTELEPSCRDGVSGAETHGFDAMPCSVRARREPRDLLTPEDDFNRSWALAVHARVMERLRAHYAAIGKLEIYQLLEANLSGEGSEQPDRDLAERLCRVPSTSDAKVLDAEELAIKIKNKTVALRTERSRMKQELPKLYRGFLRAEIGKTVSDPKDIDDEISELYAALKAPLGIVERSSTGDVRVVARAERRTG